MAPLRAITVVADSSTFSNREFWSVNASPVSISANLLSDVLMSDI
jgi:hypothetical protein